MEVWRGFKFQDLSYAIQYYISTMMWTRTLLSATLFSPSLSHFVHPKNKRGCQACRHRSHSYITDEHWNWVRDRRRYIQTDSTNPVIRACTSPVSDWPQWCTLQRTAFIGWKDVLPCFSGRLALYTDNAGEYKGLGFADNLYKPAVISYGRAILVVILVLYLALDDMCWQRIVFLRNGLCNYVL